MPTEAAIVDRFGEILGKRFTRDNLSSARPGRRSAYAGLRKAAAAIRGHGANIFTQWSGDPDALGSAVLLEAILRDLGAHDVRILTGSLGHPQNRNLVEKCGIVLRHPNHERIARGLHCTVDTSPPLGMSNTAPVEPVRSTSSWPTTTPTPTRWRRTAAPRACAASSSPSWGCPWARRRRSWP